MPELIEDFLVRTSGVLSILPRDKYFCLTSSVVNGAPVVRIAFDEPTDVSVEPLESELADLADFLWPASDARLVVGVAVFEVLRCVCCNEPTDSSDSSALDTAYRKYLVRFLVGVWGGCLVHTSSSCFTHKKTTLVLFIYRRCNTYSSGRRVVVVVI